jgi:iduronate 2-sulfatase
VELLDLFPTLVELCGLTEADGLEGASLVAVLRDPTAHVKKAALTQFPRPAYYDRETSMTPQAMGCSVRTDLVRYTEWRDWKTGAVIARELYDARRDPTEMHNDVDLPELADAQADAAARLHQQFPAAAH